MRAGAAWARGVRMRAIKSEKRAGFRRDGDSFLFDVDFRIKANLAHRLALSPPSLPFPVKGEGVRGDEE
jgi:hypothetical protein